MASLDVLPDISAIALFLYNTNDLSAQRRVRRRIANGDIPVRRTSTGRVESRRSWIEALYAAPDAPLQTEQIDEPESYLPKCAFDGCTASVNPRRSHVGRPTRYCAEHQRGRKPSPQKRKAGSLK